MLRDAEGFLIAGKAISGTHIAMSAYRVMPIAGSIGQAAGAAAALCAQQNLQPRSLDPVDIRKVLQSPEHSLLLAAGK